MTEPIIDNGDGGNGGDGGDGDSANTPIHSGDDGSFYSALPAELQAHPNAEKFRNADIPTVFKSYNEAASMIGRDKIVKPNFGDEADVARFNAEMGVPESVDGYKESLKGSEWANEQGYDPSDMADLALIGELRPDQAAKIEQAYLAKQQATFERQAQEAVDLKGVNDQQLRAEMGDKYDEKMAMTDSVIEKFSRTPEAAQALRALAEKDPLVRASLSDMGAKFAEHSIGDFQPKSFAISKSEAQEQVDALRGDMKSAYWDDTTDRTAHNNAVDKVNRLEAFIAGGKG